MIGNHRQVECEQILTRSIGWTRWNFHLCRLDMYRCWGFSGNADILSSYWQRVQTLWGLYCEFLGSVWFIYRHYRTSRPQNRRIDSPSALPERRENFQFGPNLNETWSFSCVSSDCNSWAGLKRRTCKISLVKSEAFFNKKTHRICQETLSSLHVSSRFLIQWQSTLSKLHVLLDDWQWKRSLWSLNESFWHDSFRKLSCREIFSFPRLFHYWPNK